MNVAFAQRLNVRPRKISGVQRVAVENDDFVSHVLLNWSGNLNTEDTEDTEKKFRVCVVGPQRGPIPRCSSAIAKSSAPLLSKPRRSCSATLNRQVRTLPSAVKRNRLQWPQNGSVTGAM